MTTLGRGLFAALTCAALAAPAAAQTSPLTNVPADTAVLVQVRGFDKAVNRLDALLKAAVPDLGPIAVPALRGQLTAALGGRELKGVAKDKPLFFAVSTLNFGGEDVEWAAIVPADKPEVFRDGLLTEEERKALKAAGDGVEETTLAGKPAFFAAGNGVAVVAPNKEAARRYAQAKRDLTTVLNKETQAALLDADVSAYVDMAAVNKQYGEQIKGMKDLMEFALQQGPAGLDKNSAEMIKTFYAGLFKAVEDSTAFVAAADFRPDGLNFRLHAQFGPLSSTNGYLKKMAPAAHAGLKAMPAGQTTYTAYDLDPAVFESVVGLLFGGSPEAADGLKALAAAGPTGFSAAADLPPKGIEVWSFKEPAKASAAILELIQSVPENGSFQNVAVKGKPAVKPDAQKHRGFSLSEVELTWDFEKAIASAPEEMRDAMKESMKKLAGESYHGWFGTDGKDVVRLTAPDWAAAQAILDGYLDGKAAVGKSPAYELAAKNLPAESTMVAFMDTEKYSRAMLGYVGAMFKAVPGVPFAIPEPNPKPGKTSYLGFALVLTPENGRFDFFVPAEGVKEVRRLVTPVGD